MVLVCVSNRNHDVMYEHLKKYKELQDLFGIMLGVQDLTTGIVRPWHLCMPFPPPIHWLREMGPIKSPTEQGGTVFQTNTTSNNSGFCNRSWNDRVSPPNNQATKHCWFWNALQLGLETLVVSARLTLFDSWHFTGFLWNKKHQGTTRITEYQCITQTLPAELDSSKSCKLLQNEIINC